MFWPLHLWRFVTTVTRNEYTGTVGVFPSCFANLCIPMTTLTSVPGTDLCDKMPSQWGNIEWGQWGCTIRHPNLCRKSTAGNPVAAAWKPTCPPVAGKDSLDTPGPRGSPNVWIPWSWSHWPVPPPQIHISVLLDITDFLMANLCT